MNMVIMHVNICQDARPPEEYDVSHVIGAIRVAPDGSDAKQTLETLTASNPGTMQPLQLVTPQKWPPLENGHSFTVWFIFPLKPVLN